MKPSKDGLLGDVDLYPFEHRYVELSENVVHFVDEGNGPIILLLHAAPAWSFIYRAFIIALRSQYRCIAFDFPGFGLSLGAENFDYSLKAQSSIVTQFIDALDLHDIVLLVHDSAGPIGLTAASQDPSRFNGLILSDTFAWSLKRFRFASLMLRLLSMPPISLVLERTALLPWIVCTIGPRCRRLSPAEKAGYLRAFDDRVTRRRVLTLFSELAQNRPYFEALELALPSLRALPALIIFGQYDPIRSFRKRFETLFPFHRSVAIAGEAHFPHEGSPDAMIDAIRSFMTDFFGDSG